MSEKLDACPNCSARPPMWVYDAQECANCWRNAARDREIDRVADIIDPIAFALLSPWEKPVDERARIEERQIVARERAKRVIAYLEGERD